MKISNLFVTLLIEKIYLSVYDDNFFLLYLSLCKSINIGD